MVDELMVKESPLDYSLQEEIASDQVLNEPPARGVPQGSVFGSQIRFTIQFKPILFI